MTATLLNASLIGVAVGLASLAAAPVHAQDGGTIIVEGERNKYDRKVCKATEPRTGTRLGARRICRTVYEWRVEEQRSRQLIEQQQMRQSAMDAHRANQQSAFASDGPP